MVALDMLASELLMHAFEMSFIDVLCKQGFCIFVCYSKTTLLSIFVKSRGLILGNIDSKKVQGGCNTMSVLQELLIVTMNVRSKIGDAPSCHFACFTP